MRGAALILLLALGGCGAKEREPAAPIDSVQLNAIASSGPTVAEVLAQGNDATPAPAPHTAAFDYRGDWATNPMLCRRNVWRFDRRTVAVGDASRCTIDGEKPSSSGDVALELTCHGAGRMASVTTHERWSLVGRKDGGIIVARSAGNGIPESTTLARCG